MTTTRHEFESPSGDWLSARLETPTGEPRTFALFAHCFTCSKDLKAVVRISRHLAKAGIAVFRFDFTGIGESEGDFPDTNFSTNLADLMAAAAYMEERLGAPELLIGHSLGGAAVLSVADRIASARAVATIAAPSDTSHLGDKLIQMAPDLEASGEASVELGGRSFKIRRQLLRDLDSHHMEKALKSLTKPLLVLHSPNDGTVDIDHGYRIFALAAGTKSFVSIDRGDHLLLENRQAAGYAADMLVAWASHSLDL